MSKKKIEKILQETELPGKISVEHKNNLMRSLNKSEKFEKKLSRKRKYLEYAFGGVMSVLIVFYLFSNKFDSAPDIQQILDRSSINYSGFSKNGSIYNFENNLSVFGKKGDILDLGVQQFTDMQSNNKRVIIKDKTGSEILDEYFFDNGNVYRTAYPKLISFNTLSRYSSKNVPMIMRVFKDSVSTDSTVDKIIKKIELELKDQRNDSESFLVYQKGSAFTPEGQSKGEGSYYFQVEEEINLDEYFSCNPVKVLASLQKADSLIYIGQADNDENSERRILIENIAQIEKRHFNALVVRFDSLVTENIVDADSIAVKYMLRDSVAEVDTFMHSVCADSFNKIERVTINAETGEISGVLIFVEKNQKRIKLADINFLKYDKTSDRSIFNHTSSELKLVGRYDEL